MTKKVKIYAPQKKLYENIVYDVRVIVRQKYDGV
jgi:hypothetical protein